MDQNSGTVYAVGQPFDPRVRAWPEGAMYVYQENIHQLLIMFKHIRPIEREAFSQGLTRFGLYHKGEVIMLLFKSDHPSGAPGIKWHDMPYSWHLVPDEARTIPLAPEDIPADLGAVFHLFLIESDTGILESMRSVNVSHDFTQQLHRAIREQIIAPFNEVRYLQHVDWIRALLPTPELVAAHADAKCIGGIFERSA